MEKNKNSKTNEPNLEKKIKLDEEIDLLEKKIINERDLYLKKI